MNSSALRVPSVEIEAGAESSGTIAPRYRQPMPVILPASFDDFINTASTCDVVLWGGSSLNSTGIEIISNSPFSHTTMVIVDPGTGDRYLLQAANVGLGDDPFAGGTSHAGVQAGLLRSTMLTLLNYKDVPTWRPYTGTNQNDPAFISAVWNLAKSFDAIPFPDVPLGMAAELFAGRVENIEITTSLFCSGLAGLMFKRLGIIDPAVPCNAYFPKDFSSLYPGYLKVISGSFGVDTPIALPTGAATSQQS